MNLEVLPNLSDHLGLFPDYTVREFTNTIHHNDKRTSIPVISKSVSRATGANDSHGQSASESETSWLFSLHAISLQILVLALFASLTSYARADTNDELPSGSASYFSSANYPSANNQGYENNFGNNPQEWLQLAALIEDEKRPVLYLQSPQQKTSWALAFDNDILAPGHRDRDYTYGLNFTYSGAGARDADISLKTPLAAIDDFFGLDHLPSSRDNYTVEAGLFGFTPQVLTGKEANPNDRPYASLVYFSSSHDQIDVVHNVAWKTTLTIGALGLGLVGELQNLAHKETSGKQANGWNNQISEGGELTGRYVIARQHYLEGLSDSFGSEEYIAGINWLSN